MVIKKYFLLMFVVCSACCRVYNPRTFKENQISKFICVAEFTMPVNGIVLANYMIESYYNDDMEPLRFWIQDSVGTYKVGQHLILKTKK